jgi:hypothetical protein
MASDLALIKKHAPILWVDKDEAFLPEHCSVMEDIAELVREDDPATRRRFKIEELGRLRNSDKYYMDIPGLDYENFGVHIPGYQGARIGPEAIADYLNRTYGNNPQTPGPAGGGPARDAKPRFFARSRRLRILKENCTRDKTIARLRPDAFGNYDVIEYFFFYLFNESWNLHIGDWDSTLRLFLNSETGAAFMLFHAHHVVGIAEFNKSPRDLGSWLADWNQREHQKRLSPVFQVGSHPFVFVARGAHGAYATPGFSVHGALDVVAQTDFRQIGNLCLCPADEPQVRTGVRDALRQYRDVSGLTSMNWEEPLLLDDQPWLKYKGQWGSRSRYSGWEGPKTPRAACSAEVQDYLKSTLFNVLGNGEFYAGADLRVFRIFKSWHGIR